MAVNKGLAKFASSSPDFSTQALENAINELKIGWVAKTFTLDTAIVNNNVLTTTQKNDARSTINNQPHLNIGRYLNDAISHAKSILDGSIVFLAFPDTEDTATFLELLQTVQGFQTSIPQLFGVPASEKNRAIDDHFGLLRGKFLTTDDSSKPVFTQLQESITYINNQSIATDTAYQTALTNMQNFVDGVVGDSTDFQQTLNTFASAVATAATNFHNGLNAEPLLTFRTQLVSGQSSVETQINLENSNLRDIRTFTNNLNDTFGYVGLTDDAELKDLLIKTSQNTDFKSYIETYDDLSANQNAIYVPQDGQTDKDLVDSLLAQAGLPDVLDSVNLDEVAEKAKKDDRIDTAGFDLLSVEEIINKCCLQLNLDVENRTIFQQSDLLLTNLNERDRNFIEERIRLNRDSDTIT